MEISHTGAVDGFEVVGYPVNRLDRAFRLLDLGNHFRVPHATPLKFCNEVTVDLHELSGERFSFEQVGHLRFDALEAASDRSNGCGGGDGDHQRVAQPVLLDALAQGLPALGI